MPNKPLPKDDPLKGIKSGGWTKYGGGRHLLETEKTETWFCQSCGEEQPIVLAPYFHEIFPKDFIKICAKCRNKVLTKHVYSYTTLVRITRIERY